MRWAKGFATGNDRGAAGGVNVEPEGRAADVGRGGEMGIATWDDGLSAFEELFWGRAGCDGNEV
jgi:hypothetical protein